MSVQASVGGSIYCVLYIILYIVTQSCHRVSVQALVGGSSSAREDSETDCEVKKFAFKKKNKGSMRLTLRIKKG